MFSIYSLSLTVCGLLASSAVAQTSQSFPLKVDLGYSVYEGVVGNASVSHWWGIRYAAPPVGDLRFRAPQEPVATSRDVIKADTHGAICRSGPSPTLTAGQSEDCLFLDVYRPSSNKTNLPVYVYIQGGGLNANSDPNKDAEKWVNASGHEIIVVTLGYRVGLYGFLASKEVKAGGDLNVGMLDQRMVFKWVQTHIKKFGGDPTKVTIGGMSAGAGSVNIHLLAYGGRDEKLFAAVHAESPSFGYVKTVEESQYQYDNLLARTDCTNATDTLTCLRNLPDKVISENNADVNTPNGGGGKALFQYSNCIDGTLIREQTYVAFRKGTYVKVPSIYGSNTNEGTVFTPRDTANATAMNNFLRNNFPKLADKQLSKIQSLYPPTEFQLPGTGKFWRSAATAYGDMRYVCSSLFVSDTLATAGIQQTYQYHWDVLGPVNSAAGNGVTHVSGINPIFGLSANTTIEAVISPYIQSYLTSFVRTAGDPNKYRFDGAPVWKASKKGAWNRIHFTNDIFNIGMETVDEEKREQCEYLTSIGPSIGQ